MGSATVVFESPEDAKKAIEDYHGALLDEKPLTVEYDTKVIRVPKIKKGINKEGRTLRVGDRRRGGRRWVVSLNKSVW